MRITTNTDGTRDVLYWVDPEFARQLELELNEAWKWKDEDPRMLREQIRVADSAYQRLHEENKRLHEENELLRESMAQL